MKKKKIYELAKEIGITPIELVDELKRLGFPIKNHMSDITQEQEDDFHFMLKQEMDERERKATAQEEAKKSFAKKNPKAPVSKGVIKCSKCQSDKIAQVQGRVKDLFNLRVKDFEYEGYVLHNLNIGSGDDLEFDYCLDCGQMQGKFPINLKNALASDDEDEDE